MQGARLGTTVLKALSASWFSAHFDQSTQPSYGTKENNDPLKCKKQKCNIEEKMKDKLREFALYVLDRKNQLYEQHKLTNLNTPLCDCKSWFHKDCEQAKKDAETKKFNEDIIEKFEEIVRDYRSFNNSYFWPFKSLKSSNNQSVGTDVENDPVRDQEFRSICSKLVEIEDAVKKDEEFRSICSKLVEIEDAIKNNDKARVRDIEAAIREHDQALVRGIEVAFKKTDNTPYWAGAIVGSLCVFSMALLMTSFK